MGLHQNLIWAKKAVEYTHKVLPSGVGNPVYVGQVTTPEAAQKVLKARMDAQEMGFSTSARTASAIWEGAGNCGEMARVALKKLKALGAAPLHLMHIPQILIVGVGAINHTFVVIEGQNLDAISGYPVGGSGCTGWGANAVICDPWISVARAANGAQAVWPPYNQNSWYFDAEEVVAGRLAPRAAEAPF